VQLGLGISGQLVFSFLASGSFSSSLLVLLVVELWGIFYLVWMFYGDFFVVCSFFVFGF
jgi:hypothetical protein